MTRLPDLRRGPEGNFCSLAKSTTLRRYLNITNAEVSFQGPQRPLASDSGPPSRCRRHEGPSASTLQPAVGDTRPGSGTRARDTRAGSVCATCVRGVTRPDRAIWSASRSRRTTRPSAATIGDVPRS